LNTDLTLDSGALLTSPGLASTTNLFLEIIGRLIPENASENEPNNAEKNIREPF
jgi:hypothetical protein